ncbi:MAG: hypothetical protein P1P89_04830 [Desulfobacterales bacterium]|nr:hypothetical protein [Desulfobacterales bacterium]
MEPNSQNPADESKISEGFVRCDALTRTGSPCKNLAIADGRCWIHGGRKKKSPPENENISGAGPVLAEAAAMSVQEKIDAENTDSGAETGSISDPPAIEFPGTVEISAADIELISEGEAPGGLPEAAASSPAEAGPPEIVWEDERPDKAEPVSGAAELDILWEDGLPDEEPSEDGMELGIEIDAGETDADESEDQPLLLPDGELPGEETEGDIDFDADSLGLEMEEEPGIETPESALQQRPGFEDWADKPDKGPSDEAVTDASVGSPDVSLEMQAESEEAAPDRTPLAAAGAAEFEDLELEILPDDELPAEEIAPGVDYAADNESTNADFSEGAPFKAPGAEDEDVILEVLPDAGADQAADEADIEIDLDDDTVFDSGESVAISGHERESESEDDWLGVNDINRFGAAAGHPKVNDVPEFAAPDGEQPNRPIPQAFYPRQTGPGSGDVAPEYKTRTTIGKFQEIHVDPSRKSEPKKTKALKPPGQKGASFWRRRVGIPAPLFWGMTCLLLFLGGISVLHYGLGIRIPYISGMLRPKVKDLGNLKIAVYGTESRFVQNSHSGPLLVISGWVRNDYNAPRGQIRVTGRLFTHNNFVKSQTVYCGDLISDEALGGLSAETIQKRLSERLDVIGPKETVAPRQTLPFMIVFSQLPEDLASLEKYTVEVTGSSQTR